MKLSDDDGQIVDLLLDRPNADPASGAFVKSVDVQPERVQMIKKVLGLLDGLPVEDPPADLISRTLSKVENAIDAGNSSSRPPPPAQLDDSQTPA